jgi:hypothetical protein
MELATEEQADTGRMHTIWECQQEAAEEIRVESRHMDCRMKEVRRCGQCSVPQTMGAMWQWDERQGR